MIYVSYMHVGLPIRSPPRTHVYDWKYTYHAQLVRRPAPNHIGHIAPPPDEKELLRLTPDPLASTVLLAARRQVRADRRRCALVRAIGAAGAATLCDVGL